MSKATNNITQIEIALGVNENGLTTSKKLYSFLELTPSNYKRWCTRNIIENESAIENTDYWLALPADEIALPADEYSPPGEERYLSVSTNPSLDYQLSAAFAKSLAVSTGNEKGKLAAEYFLSIEDKMKKVAAHYYNSNAIETSSKPKRRSPTKIEKETAAARNNYVNAQAIQMLIESLKEYVNICERAGMPAKNGLDAFSKQLAGFGIVVPDTKVADKP